MPENVTILPEIATSTTFKKKIAQQCDKLHVSYGTVVLRLLEKWVAGDIDLDIEPDPEFVASAHEAFRTEAVQKALQQLGERYDANRTYPNAVKA